MSPGVNGIADFVNQRWDVADFYRFQLMADPANVQAITASIGNDKLSKKSSSASPQIRLITKAIDAQAKQELNTLITKTLPYLDSDSRITVIQQVRFNLRTLNQNLVNHDQYLKEVGIVNPPLHTSVISRIKLEMDKLEQMTQAMQKELEQQLKKIQADFSEDLVEQRNINYKSLIFAIFQIEQKLKALQVHPSLGYLYESVNCNYLLSLKFSDNRTLVTPEIRMTLQAMGIKEELIDAAMEKGREKFSEFIHQKVLSKKALNISPYHLYIQIRVEIMAHLSREFKFDQHQTTRFAKIVKQYQDFEKEYELKSLEALERFKLTKSIHSDLSHFHPASNISTLLKSAYSDMYIKYILGHLNTASEGDMRIFYHHLKNSLHTLLMTTNPTETIKKQYITSSKRADWFARNQKNLCFTFNQGHWGGRYILEEGVCMAINYRWSIELLKNPLKKITKLADIDPAADENQSYIPITSRDRKIQAEYVVGALTNSHSSLNMPPKMLKQDGISEEILFDTKYPIPTIDELIGHLRSLYLGDDNVQQAVGIIAVALTHNTYDHSGNLIKAEKGHVTGLQIDETANIYQFWDVNSGFYSFESLKELRREIDIYLDIFYEGIYNSFLAVKYDFNE